MTVIDRNTVELMRAEILAALKPVMEKHGLRAEIGRITYQPGTEFRGKLTVTEPAKNHVVGARPKIDEHWKFARHVYRIVEVNADSVVGIRKSRTRLHGFIDRRYRIKMADLLLTGVKVK